MKTTNITADYLVKLANDVGFDRAVVLSYRGLLYAIETLQYENIGKHGDSVLNELKKLDLEIFKFLSGFFGDISNVVDLGTPRAKEHGTFLICAFSYNMEEPDDLSTDEDPHGIIAPFARRNYYKESVNRLKKVFRSIREETGLKKRDGRIFCNSRLPEKPLAYISGLGFYGKNSLIIVPGLGSLFVISVLFFPLDLENFEYESERRAIYHRIKRLNYWAGYCETCNRCVNACPVGAINPPGVLKESLCFSYISAREVELDDRVKKLWGNRLYGCQTCQDVCPYNKEIETRFYESLAGELGPSISLKSILSLEENKIKMMFKGTQMGLSWVSEDAIRRNAIVAAGNAGKLENSSLISYINTYKKSSKKILRESAFWALKRIKEKSS